MTSNQKWLTCVLVGLILIVMCCVCLGAAGYYFKEEVIDFYNEELLQYFDELEMPTPSPDEGDTTGQTNSDLELVATNNLELDSFQSGVVSTASGASIQIPAGSVPTMEDGSAGTMSFNIAEAPNSSASLPSDYSAVGPVYELGPEGFTFNSPVTITLPIPEDVDIDSVLGLTYYDVVDEVWKLVPGSVNTEERTVSVMSTHFSMWSIFSSLTGSSWNNQNGGWINVINSHTYSSGTFPGPGGQSKPMSITYGVCIESYNLDNPASANAWNKPREWQMTVSDYRSSMYNSSSQTINGKWWLPTGTYNLTEVYHISEVNQTYGYIPAYTTYYRTLGASTVADGQTVDFSWSSTDFSSSEFINGRPSCYGMQDTSVGTGDVQVTLTWQVDVDLDLYVTEPSGEEIYFGYYPSSSGGELDRDNLCSDMVIGRPENIFWPQGSAPSGTYVVSVNYFGACDTELAVNYTVRIVVEGVASTYSGTISTGTQEVTTFEVP